MMFRPECCVVIVDTAILHNICFDWRLPAPEVDAAASDSDGGEGDDEALVREADGEGSLIEDDGEGDDRQQGNCIDGVIARYSFNTHGFPASPFSFTNNSVQIWGTQYYNAPMAPAGG